MLRREFLAAAPVSLLAGLPLLSSQESRKSCILLILNGGPSQIDTWDPKPDAPSNIRSPWRAIRTNVPGLRISELFPRMARHADKYTLVRSVYHEMASVHDIGHQFVQTGTASITGEGARHIGCATGSHALLPFRLGNTGSGDISNGQAGVDPLPHAAFDFAKEPVAVREAYGRNRFGQSCLMARRLIEKGTRFVTVNMFETVFDEVTWDAHGSKPFSDLSGHCDIAAPTFDQAYTALLTDLAARNLLASTLVVATGEFGRTPQINPIGGRDHWPQCWTAILAGGGIPGGQVYGSSDRTASEPRDNPVHASRIAATMAHKLGNPLPGIEPLFL